MNLYERIALWGSTLLVAASGIVYGFMKYLMTTDDPYAVVHHPWQPFFLKLHILTSPLLVFAFGLVFTKHIWKQQRSKRPEGRVSGYATYLTWVPMVVSGYLIQSVSHDRWLWWFVAVHLIAGGTYLLGMATHKVVVVLWGRENGQPRMEECSEATGTASVDRRD